MKRRPLLLLFAMAITAGCASTGKPFAPHTDLSSGHGVVYVFRPQAKGLAILSAVMEVDGHQVTILENGEYAPISLPAGSHSITQRWKAGLLGNSKLEDRPISISIIVAAGKMSFVKLGMASSWGVQGSMPLTVQNEWEWDLRELGAQQAMAELRACRKAT